MTFSSSRRNSKGKKQSRIKKLIDYVKLQRENTLLRNRLIFVEKQLKRLRKINENQEKEIIGQRDTIDEILGQLNGFPYKKVNVLLDNKEIIQNIIDTIKEAKDFILITTHLIQPTKGENKKLNELFNVLREKADAKKVKNICIRYYEYRDPEKTRTTRQMILSRLGNSSRIDVDSERNLHYKMVMNEKVCLIFSNNLDEISFREENREIAVRIIDRTLLKKISTEISTQLNISFS